MLQVHLVHQDSRDVTTRQSMLQSSVQLHQVAASSAPQDRWVLLDHLDRRDTQEWMEDQVVLDGVDKTVILVRRVHQENLDRLGIQETMDVLDHQGRTDARAQELLDSLVCRDRAVNQEKLAKPEKLELPEHPAHEDHLDMTEHQATKVWTATPEPLEHQAALEETPPIAHVLVAVLCTRGSTERLRAPGLTLLNNM